MTLPTPPQMLESKAEFGKCRKTQAKYSDVKKGVISSTWVRALLVCESHRRKRCLKSLLDFRTQRRVCAFSQTGRWD